MELILPMITAQTQLVSSYVVMASTRVYEHNGRGRRGHGGRTNPHVGELTELSYKYVKWETKSF